MDIELGFFRHYLKVPSMKKIVEENLREEFFYDQSYRRIFAFSFDYFVRSNFTKVVTLELLEEEFSDWFKRHEWPEEEYLLDLLIEKLKERYQRVQLENVLREVAGETLEDPARALELGVTKLSQIKIDTSTKDRQELYGEKFDARVEAYYDRVLAVQELREPRGIAIGWPEVTEACYGIKPPELGVVVGSPNVGKSWAMAKIALEAASDGAKVYFASLENSKELTLMRLDCILSGVPFKAYERGRLSREQVDQLKSAREQVESLGDRLVIDTPRRKNERTAAELYNRARFIGADMLVGDQLSWLTPRRRGVEANTKEGMDELIPDLADLSKDTGIVSLWACQFNRLAMSKYKGRGGMTHIALSSTIEQTVDWAFSVSTTEEMRANEMILFEIIKARRTGKKAWLLRWQLELNTLLRVERVYND